MTYRRLFTYYLHRYSDNAMLSYDVIKNLIQASGHTFSELSKIYNRLPGSRCLRQCHCCALLPEMNFVEALSAFRRLHDFDPAKRKKLFRRLVGYFFLNAVEIKSCPFLDGKDCQIYADRFFGCRAYGFWSKQYYQKRASSSRKAKKMLQQQWKNLGVALPRTVIDFHQPYCQNLKPEENVPVDDAMLDRLGDRIEMLSAQFSTWQQAFSREYYSDLSFLSTALVFGAVNAVQMKFVVVRDIISTGNRQRLNEILDKLPDLDELTSAHP